MAIISSGIYPINPNITDGTQLASYINELVAAINSQQLSNTRPPIITKGGVWSKQVSDTEIAVMLYDGTQDVQVASIVGGESSTNGGGGEGTVADGCIYLNNQVITSDYVFPLGKNGMSAGPISIEASVEVGDGTWTIVGESGDSGGETATLESLGIPNHDRLSILGDGVSNTQVSFDDGSVTTSVSCGAVTNRFVIKNGHAERIAVNTDGRVDITGSLYVNGSEVGGGSAKAFSKMAVYNHSGGSIRKQTGLSSISKSGNLILVFNFSGATTDANYFVSAMHGRGTKSDDGNCAVGLAPNGSGNLPSTTKCTVAYCEGGTAAPLNSTHCMFGLAEI